MSNHLTWLHQTTYLNKSLFDYHCSHFFVRFSFLAFFCSRSNHEANRNSTIADSRGCKSLPSPSSLYSSKATPASQSASFLRPRNYGNLGYWNGRRRISG
ncbi:hypothetical protein AAHE18_08G141100 [Arachis hypogaea]